MIKEIAFSAYPAKNVEALRKWYETNLHLAFSAPYVENGVEMYNEANIGGGYFSLMSSEWMESAAGSGNGVSFEVDDLDTMREELKKGGVESTEPYATPVCKLSMLKDLEGNTVILHQTTVPH